MAGSGLESLHVIIAGGGIGGLATALGLGRLGCRVTVLEKASQLGEIGAGIQLGPNAFQAMEVLGVRDNLLRDAVFIDKLILMDGISEQRVAEIPVNEPFRQRFGNPYAVIHRADLHKALQAGCEEQPNITLLTSQEVAELEQDADSVTVTAADGRRYQADALIGADGIRSKVREALIHDGPPNVSGHVVYRAVLPFDEFPEALRWNAATLWAGPKCHLVHYPLRGWKLFNVVATFHSGRTTEGANEPGDRNEVLERFAAMGEKPHLLLNKPKEWRRWVLADREPIEHWTHGRITLLGDAAHPMLQYFAQGACIAMEDAVVLAACVAQHQGDVQTAFIDYQNQRHVRAARVQLSSRMLGRVYHSEAMERHVRNQLMGEKRPEDFYRGLDWIYGYKVPSLPTLATSSAAV
jgi:2-polyprenyl-6-methoxyphenol hydroxylase-like FAD-dependent oxidoreductase